MNSLVIVKLLNIDEDYREACWKLHIENTSPAIGSATLHPRLAITLPFLRGLHCVVRGPAVGSAALHPRLAITLPPLRGLHCVVRDPAVGSAALHPRLAITLPPLRGLHCVVLEERYSFEKRWFVFVRSLEDANRSRVRKKTRLASPSQKMRIHFLRWA